MTDDQDRDITMTHFAIADASGRIVVTGHAPAFHIDIQTPPDGGSVVRGKASLEDHHVVDGAIALRPVNPARLDGTTLTGLPVPSTVRINGKPYVVDDGVLEMRFPQPGRYAIEVESPFPYLGLTTELRA
jgi:hypothetical protein